ncbi:hypothetical protein HUG15_19730 [Salicibibacter cibarius]|uniref:Uncharacterized protein n=1 Tax=Salicibibacter cibarius TaxID=2743000 RepID=A0A7T6Z6I8_9BACI|nr:hypothetical protein [Salicibibacter cibarius]QQK77592.1 hypothetical protein HUG15_19730 [Salicibibacter cibarius]
MKRILLISLISALIIGAITLIWINQQEEQEAETQAVLNEYVYTSNLLNLEMEADQYKDSGHLEDIILIPTEETEEMLERWQAISKVVSDIEFPEESIEQEEWINVKNAFVNNRPAMEDASNKLGEIADYDESVDWQSIHNYIYSGSISRDYLQEFLIEEGIEEETQ